MFLRVVGSCCSKFLTGQTFESTTPSISFVQGIAERSTTMMDPLAQLFQLCWGHARALHMVSLETVTQLLRLIDQQANIGPTLLGVVASV